MYPQNGRELRLFDKLALSNAYMWSDDKMEVSTAEAVKILEAERQALIKEREEFEQEKAAFYAEKEQAEEPIEITNIEQPVKRRGRQKK